MRPLVKICGVRRAEDARLAADLGAAAIGFIFWPGSPRFIDPYRAAPIVRQLPPFVVPVGVFVDQPQDYIAGVAGLLNLGAIQLHGNEPVQLVEGLRRIGCWRLIKALPVRDGVDTPGTARTLPQSVTVLLDAHDPVKRGGTGRTIDWTQAAAAARERRIVLSGGLTPENVGEAIASVRPYAVDVSSGVESAPGIKDPAKLAALFEAIHRARVPHLESNQ